MAGNTVLAFNSSSPRSNQPNFALRHRSPSPVRTGRASAGSPTRRARSSSPTKARFGRRAQRTLAELCLGGRASPTSTHQWGVGPPNAGRRHGRRELPKPARADIYVSTGHRQIVGARGPGGASDVTNWERARLAHPDPGTVLAARTGPSESQAMMRVTNSDTSANINPDQWHGR